MRICMNIVFPSNIKIVSVNKQYELKRGKQGKIYGFYLNPEVAAMMNYIQKSLKDQGYKPSDISNEWGAFQVEFAVLMKENYFKRDLDNTLKHSLDSIFRYFGRNDVMIIDIHAHKYLNPNADFEALMVAIEGVGFDDKLWNLDRWEITEKPKSNEPSPEIPLITKEST